MMRSRAVRPVAAFAALAGGALAAAATGAARGPAAPALSGAVSDAAGRPVAAGFVLARAAGSAATAAAVTDGEGRYRLPPLRPGTYRVEARAVGFLPSVREGVTLPGGTLDFVLDPAPDARTQLPTSSWLRILPEGTEKRRFILDCTGCHGLDALTALVDGAPRSRESWEEAVARMLSFAGPGTTFPVIGPRDPARTAGWLVGHLGEPGGAGPGAAPGPLAIPAGDASGSEITEYDLPEPADLPHDLALAPDGRVVITGMMTHRMYVLDPATAEFSVVPIPVPDAGPRAVEIDAGGTWWVLLGGALSIGALPPGGEWRTWPIGVYPHSLRLDGEGRVWFNGHFTRDPVRIGALEPATGAVRMYDVAPPPMEPGAQPIPYGLRVGPRGEVWMTELAGNRLVRLDPRTGGVRVWTLPEPHAGPRRPDVDAEGTVWIPEYATNRLARFDPRAERFAELELPVPDALPYVVRVDARRDRVWIGTAGADALILHEPRKGTFRVFPLPTRGALLRHIQVDERTGDVWGAYGPWPPVAPRIVRLRVS